MATADETAQRTADAEEHRKIYQGIMKASAEIGVPFCMGLAMFFTQLVMANGLGVACLSFIVVYVLAWWVAKTFFSH
ncbi:MAG: hypothetical protein AB7F91_11365 [Parvularculaceae bacterium]|nr:hypothetical protein [Parvularculaceae bacterium]